MTALLAMQLHLAAAMTAPSQRATSAPSRRSLLRGVVGTTLLPGAAGAAAAAPVVVIGANGRTGSECVKALLARSTPVVACTRSGNDLGLESKLLSTKPCDVVDRGQCDAAVKGAAAVIFAASASKQGGAPAAVDNAGLVNVAEACLAGGVPRLVVSSGAVYLFLNVFGKIMEEKIKGEDAVRRLYASSASCAYTVVRPGGLTEEAPKGVALLELNQGDTKSGRIARADVAAICVESLAADAAKDATFECYDADTAKPLASVGLSNILKKTNAQDDVVFKSGFERNGATWPELFRGLERDAPLRA
jgi:uncharacterized protein YbjT (DUF2867 family)